MSNKPPADNPCRERRADVFALQSESATRCGADDRQRCGRRRLVEQQLSAFRLWTDSTFPSATTPKELVKIAKHRCIIGRDYEGPGWRGLHHHATLCIAAYGFLVTERSHSPYIYIRAGRLELRAPGFPPDFHPRGSPRAPSLSLLHRNHAHQGRQRYLSDSLAAPRRC
jgi:hypothetical protein